MPKEALPGLRRGLRILEALGQEPTGLRFGDIQSLCDGAPPSTISRLVGALLDEALIRQDETSHAYRLTERARNLGVALAGAAALSERVRPAVRQLAERTGQSAAFFVFDGTACLLLAKHEPPEAFHYMSEGNANGQFTRHGFARVLMAFQPPAVQERLLSQSLLPPHASRREFAAEQEQIRQDRQRINLEDDAPGVGRIVAPVLGRGGNLLGAIGLSFFQGAHLTDHYGTMAQTVCVAARQAATLAMP